MRFHGMAVDFDNGPFEASRISTTLWRKIGGTLEELWRNFGGTLEELPPILQISLCVFRVVVLYLFLELEELWRKSVHPPSPLSRPRVGLNFGGVPQ